MGQQRIALYTASLRVGGVERVAVRLSTEFIERGYPVDIVLARAEGPLLDLAPRQARIVNLNSSRVSVSLPGLRNYFAAQCPAAVLTLQTHCNVVGLAAQRLARRPPRLIVSEHNSIFPRMRRSFSREAILLKLVRWAYPHAQGIVAVSRGLASELAKVTGMDLTRITTIYNPIVDAALTAQAQEPLDHLWFSPGQPPVVLSVGRLVPQKDHATLLRAFSRLRAGRAARLVILGDGKDRKSLELLASKLGVADDVSLPGFESNPYRYMRRCAVFVLSSAWEGSGNVLAEAMACGAPVVSTDCPSGPAEILGDGKYGPLVAVGDHEALAAAIEASLDHPPPPGDLRSRADVFSSSRSADAYLKLLMPEAG